MCRIEFLLIEGGVSDHLVQGFINVYREAFRGSPYFEIYSDDEVRTDVWIPHFSKGVITLAVEEGLVVGFGCALPVLDATISVGNFLEQGVNDGILPIKLSESWYMSELGVKLTHRGRRIAYRLTLDRLSRIKVLGGHSYVMRTAAMASNSLHLYRKIGAIELPRRQDIAESDQVMCNMSKSKERVYLYGQCNDAIKNIRKIIG